MAKRNQHHDYPWWVKLIVLFIALIGWEPKKPGGAGRSGVR